MTNLLLLFFFSLTSNASGGTDCDLNRALCQYVSFRNGIMRNDVGYGHIMFRATFGCNSEEVNDDFELICAPGIHFYFYKYKNNLINNNFCKGEEKTAEIPFKCTDFLGIQLAARPIDAQENAPWQHMRLDSSDPTDLIDNDGDGGIQIYGPGNTDPKTCS